MSERAKTLRNIRLLLAAIAPGRWSRAADADGEFCDARGPMGELLPVARFHPGATDDEKRFLADAPAMVAFLLGLLDEAFTEIRALKQGGTAPAQAAATGRPKDFAAEAAMKCGEGAFQRFLAEKHGLEPPLSSERTAQKLRSLCGVTSRAELNDGGRATAAWRALRAEFDAWRRGQA